MKKGFMSSPIGQIMITAGFLAAASAICAMLQHVSPTDTHVPLIFVLAVVCVSRFTDGYLYGILASVIAVIGVNYAFTYPYLALNFSLTGYPITFLVMLTTAAVVSAMTTQIKQHERLQAEMEKEKMRANLLRAVSHDLRTPLTSIMGAADVLLEETKYQESGNAVPSPQAAAQRTQLIKDIYREAEWLSRIVENILSVTRLNAEEARIRCVPELAEEVAESAVQKFRKHFPEMPVNVRVPEDVLLVPMDAILIEQVLVNLLENAAQHGGDVHEISLEVRKDENQAVFEVADDGQGFSREELQHLFDGKLPLKERESGPGRSMRIGLSVCQSIIQAHEGSLQASNRPGGGAVVSFRLPLEENAAYEAE